MKIKSLLNHSVLSLVWAIMGVCFIGFLPRALGDQAVKIYPDVVSELKELELDFPKKVKTEVFGLSDEGIPIWGVRLGDFSRAVDALVIASQHGDEWQSTEVALAFAKSLAQDPLLHRSLLIIPVVNIWGYNHRMHWESKQGRYFDSNRDFPGPCGSEGPFKLASTQALAQIFDQYQIVATASLHTYYPAVTFPWGVPAKDLMTPYEVQFSELAESAVSRSGYPFGRSGQLLSQAVGTFEDFTFWKFGSWSLLFEMGSSNQSTGEDLEHLIASNVSGLRSFFLKAPNSAAPLHSFEGQCLESSRD